MDFDPDTILLTNLTSESLKTIRNEAKHLKLIIAGAYFPSPDSLSQRPTPLRARFANEKLIFLGAR